MRTVTIHIAKTHLSRLLEEVAAGEEIVTAKAGKPVARLLPYAPKREPRQPGLLKGKIWIADDFDDRCPRRSWRRFAVSVPEISARHPPGDLPRHHDDPFDRMLVAQAIAEGFTLISSNPWLRSYQVALLKA